MVNEVKTLLKTEEANIEVKEGPDFLCEACPYFDGQGCSHPEGGEAAIKKWDGIMLKALDLEFGQMMQVKEMDSLVGQRAPLSFCLNKCPHHRENRCDPRAIGKHL